MKAKAKGVPTADIRGKLDNPLVFLVLITVFVAGGFKIGQWLGTKFNSPGLSSFFGGK